ncbi:MAG TPA: SpoIIE family protein phosphatase, partial [Candidatus Gracilibacteria bacterium]|nr:SpoIIE family protein phosphatase [Candidatus Gracilibacteria bacterium]
SATSLSGDVYDFVSSHDEETIFYLGDATGHGLAAGLVMTMINTLTYSIINQTNNIKEVLVSLNREIKPKLVKNMFTSMIMCKWHHALKEFSYVGAGHEHILHYHGDTQEVEAILTGGIAIGMLNDISGVIKEKTIEVKESDLILLYTDGLTETWNEEKTEIYGLERVKRDLLELSDLEPEAIIDEYLRRIEKFRGKGEKTDDVSLILLKRIHEPGENLIRNHYLEKKLKQDILKTEILIKSNTDEFSPSLMDDQKSLVQKEIDLARIYLSEQKGELAMTIIKKGLQIEPENSILQELLVESRKYVLPEGKGIKTFFFRLWRNLFKEPATDVAQEYQEMMKEKIESLMKNHHFWQAQNLIQDYKNIVPEDKTISKMEKKIASYAQQTFPQVMRSVFPLPDPVKNLKEENLMMKLTMENQLLKERLVESKPRLEYKKDLNVDINFTAGTLNTKSSLPNDENYRPEMLLGAEDVFGLKKLLANKQKEQSDKISETETKIELPDLDLSAEEVQKIKNIDGKPEKNAKSDVKPKANADLNLKWDNGAMERKTKTYNPWMAKLSPMNKKDFYGFIEKLAAFIKAGIPLVRALEIIQDQAHNDGFIYVLDHLITSINSGKMLSQSLMEFPQHFSEMFVYLVQAGEKSGSLPLILQDLAIQMKEQQQITSKIRSAMIYPTLIVSASLMISIALVTFVIPKLVKSYTET